MARSYAVMLFWSALAVLVFVTLVALLRPLLARGPQVIGGSAREVFAAQLGELEADRDRGLISPADAVASHRRGEAICHFWENDPHQLHLADIQSGIARPPFYASTDELARACQTISEDEAWANTNAMRAMDGLPPLERPDTPQ